MNQGRAPADLLFSQPGEWIGRSGTAASRPAIRRILVLKPDHIGDFLIAARGFALLRHFFPDAAIDLVCGSWNVGLAKRLGYFDDVHGVDLFHEISGEQSELEVADLARREGLKRLSALRLGTYDIAIDMRFDQDSRAILPLIDARIYAGYGARQAFPFLDIALPMASNDDLAANSEDVVLNARNFHRSFGGHGQHPMTGAGNASVQSARGVVALDFLVSGATSPADCGTLAADVRALGIALTGIAMQPMLQGAPVGAKVRHSALVPQLVLISGWAPRESWGVWGIGGRCRILLELPPYQGEDAVEIAFDLTAHVNFANPLVTTRLQCTSGEQGEVVAFQDPQNQGICTIAVNRLEKTVQIVSETFRLAAGAYSVQLRLYIPALQPQASLRIGLRGVSSEVLSFERHVDAAALKPGFVDLVYTCTVESGDALQEFFIDVHDAQSILGMRVEMLVLSLLRRAKLGTPTTHMETHARLLALRVAMEFSSVEPFGQPDETADRLGRAGQDAGENAEAALDRILAWQAEGCCVVGIALGCNSQIRKWPVEYFTELASELLKVENLRLVFFGSRGERSDAVAVCQQLGLDPALHVLCGEFGLDALGAVLRPLDLFIGSNTGSTHYAGRMGVRTIGIYAGTNHPREWGPVGDNASWIYRDEACAVCSLTLLKDCRHGHRCLINIAPRDVLAVALPEVLAVLGKRSAGCKGSTREAAAALIL